MPRGINVGTRFRVPTADLRSELAEAGYTQVGPKRIVLRAVDRRREVLPGG